MNCGTLTCGCLKISYFWVKTRTNFELISNIHVTKKKQNSDNLDNIATTILKKPLSAIVCDTFSTIDAYFDFPILV